VSGMCPRQRWVAPSAEVRTCGVVGVDDVARTPETTMC
jgi:hypothetical protein